MGHRIAIMEKGVLQQVAPPADVYARPANVFVAGFIGNPPMNLLPATLADVDGATVARLDGLDLPLTAELAAQAREAGSSDVMVGIRPEHVRIDPSSGFRASVAVVEELGHERHDVCETAGGVLVTARADSESGGAPEVGESVGLALDATTLHLFDAASGLRIGP